MIELKKLTKIYKAGGLDYLALDSINIRINSGEMVAITGSSGAGKSTLLNIIGCLDTLTEGELSINGCSINNLSKNDLAKIRNTELGFIFQNFSLISNYTISENIELALKYNKIYKKNSFTKLERKKIVLETLDMVGLKDISEKLPSQISGGQQQRVSIARALVTNPSIILADEPTGSLDKKNGEDILNILSDINGKGKTIIIVTHDLEIAKRCSKNIVIEDGRVKDMIINS
ncbi:MAG: ABC transporter ATP-binding protein [Aeromonas sp.]